MLSARAVSSVEQRKPMLIDRYRISTNTSFTELAIPIRNSLEAISASTKAPLGYITVCSVPQASVNI